MVERQVVISDKAFSRSEIRRGVLLLLLLLLPLLLPLVLLLLLLLLL